MDLSTKVRGQEAKMGADMAPAAAWVFAQYLSRSVEDVSVPIPWWCGQPVEHDHRICPADCVFNRNN